MTTIELFLRLVRQELWQTPQQLPERLSPTMFAYLLRGAREQAMIGIVAHGLLHSGMALTEEQQLQLGVLLMQVRRSNADVNAGLQRLKTLLDTHRIPFALVKGQAAAAAYPDPSLRQAGDIDYLCPPTAFADAAQVVGRAWDIDMRMPAGTDWLHIHYEHDGVVYEAHRCLVRLYGRKAERRWQQLVGHDPGATVAVGDMQVATLSPELHVVYVFLHLYSHLLGLGVGLRQMCDLAMLLHRHRHAIATDHLLGTLRQLGFYRAYRAVGTLLAEQLCLPADCLGFRPNDTDRRYAGRIFAVVRYRGNMGFHNKRSGFTGWRHNAEATAIKLAHFMKFFPLAPAFSTRWIAYELTKKLLPRPAACPVFLYTSRVVDNDSV